MNKTEELNFSILGTIPSFSIPSAEDIIDLKIKDISSKIFETIKRQATQTNFPLLSDTTSLLRNGLLSSDNGALNSLTRAGRCVAGLGIIGGVSSTISGAKNLATNIHTIATSTNQEEVQFHALHSIQNIGLLAFGLAATSSWTASLVQASGTISSAISTLVTVPALYVLNGGAALYSLTQIGLAGSLRSDLNRLEQEPPEKVAPFFKELLANEEKASYLSRRLGVDLETAKGFLEKIEHVTDVSSKNELLSEMSRHNFKHLFKHALIFLLSVAGLCAAAALGPAGSFMFLVYLAAISIVLDFTKGFDYLSDAAWKAHELFSQVGF